MSRMMSVIFVLGVVLSLVIGQFGGASAAPPAQEPVKELTIIWHQWELANILQDVVNAYTDKTGVKVTVVAEPPASWGDRVFSEFAAKGTAFDLVVGDSQWLGQGATQGHYVELTDIFFSELNGNVWLPATVAAYAEYPKGGKRYWSVPLNGDAQGFAYRKDLFEDPNEQAAFKAKYGYALEVPKTWAAFRDAAEFFTRPEKNLYGVALHVGKDYDCVTMVYENFLYCWGAAWGDYQTYQVKGILNAPNAVQALEFFKELTTFMPPGSGNMCWQEANDAFVTGQVAMAVNWFAWFVAMSNPAMNPLADKTGFASNPSGPYGHRFAAIGGQGVSINNYLPEDRKKAALEFIKWWSSDEAQAIWAEKGGNTCNANVLNSKEWLEAEPYHPPLLESLAMTVDFWAVPPYSEMLTEAQRLLNGYLVAGEGTAQSTLDTLAEEHEAILKKAGLPQ